MAINVNDLMKSRYPHLMKKQQPQSQDQLLKDTYVAFQSYGKELHTHFGQLIKYVETSEDRDEFLIDSMDTVRDLIKRMQEMEKGSGSVSNKQLLQFFEMFHDTMEQLDNFTQQKPDHPYTDQVKKDKAKTEKARKDREEADDRLVKSLGERFEGVMADNADAVGSAQGNMLKIGLASFLGPAAPLVNVFDQMFGIEKRMAGLTKKMFTRSEAKDKADESKDEDDRARQEEHQAEYRQSRVDQAEEKTWRQAMLERLGLVADHSKGAANEKKGLTGFLGGLAKKFGGILGGSRAGRALGGVASSLGKVGGTVGRVAARVAPVAAIATGAYGVYDAASNLAGDKYRNKDGSRKGFLEGGLDSRGGEYGKAALSGAAMGAGIGSIIPGLGTAVGGLVGGALGAGAAVIADYKDEIKGFLDDTGVTKLVSDGVDSWMSGWKKIGGWIVDLGKNTKQFLDDTGVTRLAGDTLKVAGKAFDLWLSGWKKIGGWVVDIGSMIDKSGVLQAAGGAAFNATKTAVTNLVGGVRTIASWLSDAGGLVADSTIVKMLAGVPFTVVKGAVDGVYTMASFIAGVPDTLGKASDYAIMTFTDMGARIKKWYDEVRAEVKAFTDDPIGYLKKKAIEKATAVKDAVVNGAKSAAGVAANVTGAASKAATSAGQAVTEGAAAVGDTIEKGGKQVAEAVKPYSQTASSAVGKGAEIAGAAVAGAGKAVGKVAGWVGDKLGALSAKFESGNKGPAAVGWDSTGGTSYGTYQIAAKTGTLGQYMGYLAKTNPEWYKRLVQAGNPDGGKNGQFAQVWKQIAAEDPKGFDASQHDFIKQTHYDPAAKRISKATGIDVNQRSKVLQDVLWSTSVQHGPGGAASIFVKALKDAGGENAKDQAVVSAVYQIRRGKFGSSTDAVRASVNKRFDTEQSMALSALDSGTGTAPSPVGSAPTGPGTGPAATASASSAPAPTKVASTTTPTSSPVGKAPAVPVASARPSVAPVPVQVAKSTSTPGSDYERVNPMPPLPLVEKEMSTGAGMPMQARLPSAAGTLSVDSVPSTITDEGLLILNMSNMV